jgi:hypothetical protein
MTRIVLIDADKKHISVKSYDATSLASAYGIRETEASGILSRYGSSRVEIDLLMAARRLPMRVVSQLADTPQPARRLSPLQTVSSYATRPLTKYLRDRI